MKKSHVLWAKIFKSYAMENNALIAFANNDFILPFYFNDFILFYFTSKPSPLFKSLTDKSLQLFLIFFWDWKKNQPNYLNERRGAHLFFYLSEEVFIQGALI